MIDIHFEFPNGEADRPALIAKHRRAGRQWVSTALVDGHQRMKFARFIEAPVYEEPHNWNSPEPYVSQRAVKRQHKRKMDRRLARYAGQENSGGRSEWDR